MRMKRLLLFATVVASVTGCPFPLQSIFPPRATSGPTPTPHLTATALAKQAPLLATLAAQSDFKWNVSIVQGNNVIVAKNGEFQLQRKPFTFRIEVSKPVEVNLNALDTDDNFLKVHSGLATDDRCVQVHPFCSLRGMQMVIAPNELVINKEEPYGGNQAFALDPDLGELGSQFTITSNSIVFERYISQITIFTQRLKTDTGTKHIFTKVPIEEFTSDKLYLVFLAKHRSINIINEDELKKFVVTFR